MSDNDNEQTIASMAPHQVHHTSPRSSVFYVSLTRLNKDAVSVTTPAPPTDYETWRDEMQRVHEELERVRLLNMPTTRQNRAISKANTEQPDASLRNGLKPLPFKPDKWVQPFILREEHHSSGLAKKTPKEWAQDIILIKDRVLRSAVARIVWWDFFAHRSARNRWPHLDNYLDGEYVKLDKESLKRGLALVGYSPWHAHRRLNATFDYAREHIGAQDHGRHLRRKQIVKNPFHNNYKK